MQAVDSDRERRLDHERRQRRELGVGARLHTSHRRVESGAQETARRLVQEEQSGQVSGRLQNGVQLLNWWQRCQYRV